MTRRIVQIATNAMPGDHHADTGGHGPAVELYALCDDGSLWEVDYERDPDQGPYDAGGGRRVIPTRRCWRRS